MVSPLAGPPQEEAFAPRRTSGRHVRHVRHVRHGTIGFHLLASTTVDPRGTTVYILADPTYVPPNDGLWCQIEWVLGEAVRT